MSVCETTGNPEHDTCEHCGTCHTCCEEWDDQQSEARKQLNIALEKANTLLEEEREKVVAAEDKIRNLENELWNYKGFGD